MRRIFNQECVVIICPDCGLVKRFSEWVNPSTEELKKLCEYNRNIKPILDRCPKCTEKFAKGSRLRRR